jgi:hypothetical protein
MKTPNASWHEGHPMPARASLDQRVVWHLAHAKACGCRGIPDTVLREVERRGRKPPRPRKRRPVAP